MGGKRFPGGTESGERFLSGAGHPVIAAGRPCGGLLPDGFGQAPFPEPYQQRIQGSFTGKEGKANTKYLAVTGTEITGTAPGKASALQVLFLRLEALPFAMHGQHNIQFPQG